METTHQRQRQFRAALSGQTNGAFRHGQRRARLFQQIADQHAQQNHKADAAEYARKTASHDAGDVPQADASGKRQHQ
jgi:hypothetical protein